MSGVIMTLSLNVHVSARCIYVHKEVYWDKISIWSEFVDEIIYIRRLFRTLATNSSI